MARFTYHARDGQGDVATGTLTAPSLAEAGRMLRAEGKFIVRLALTGEGDAPDSAAADRRGRGVKRPEVVLFAHQMAVMVETGVPLSEAINCCAEQAGSDAMKEVLRAVTDHVQAGGELSAAMRKFPRVFPTVMTSLIKASEVSGTLAPMLDRIARYLAKEHQTLKQVRGALMYPTFLLLMAVSATIFLLGFVLPKFAKIYESRQAVLPAPTRLLLGISDGLVAWWYVWLTLAAAVVAGLLVLRRTPSGRRLFDYLKLNVPVLRQLFLNLYVSRASRTLGTLIGAGVSMLDAVAIVKQVTGNAYYDDLWDQVDERLRQGSQLSEPLFASPLIPRPISQMIYSGERSGRLGQVLGRVAEFTEAEFDQSVKTATQFIEPVIIGAMGTLIGFIAISLLLPIFSVGRVVSGG